ncbi:hypothetical protein [Brevibacillus sp. 179-C9.3 HS]|uniref:hypothetical protein n=1 Tax=unclassified Brevibacillus TaxID=2684853 RepID=UPI0039A1626F
MTPDGSRVYVTNIYQNTVSVINIATNTKILPRIPVGDFPFAIAITPNCVHCTRRNLSNKAQKIQHKGRIGRPLVCLSFYFFVSFSFM